MPTYSEDFYKNLASKGLEPTVSRDDAGEFGRGLKGSFAQAGNMIKAGAGLATGRDEWVFEGATDSKLDAAEFGGDTENFTDIHNAGAAADWLGYQAGSATGNLAQIVATGGVAGLMAKGAGKMAGRSAIDDALGLGVSTKTGAMTGVAGTGFVQQTGETGLAIYDETGEIHAGKALATGAVQASLDFLPVMSAFKSLGVDGAAKAAVMKKVSPSRLKQVAKEAGKIGGQEAVTEAMQQTLQLAALEWANENKDHFNAEGFEQIVNAAAAGAVGGLVMGAPAAGVGALRSPSTTLSDQGQGGASSQSMGDVVDKIVGNESSGRADAKNPLSSAEGLGQFIDSTWLAMVKKHRPDVAQGKSDAELLNLKTDGDLSREMTTRYAEDNARDLSNRGHAATPQNIYLAHHFGIGGADSLLKSDRSAMAEDVLGAETIAANPRYKGKSVGWLVDRIGRKMGGGDDVSVAKSPNKTSAKPDDGFPLDAEQEKRELGRNWDDERFESGLRQQWDAENADAAVKLYQENPEAFSAWPDTEVAKLRDASTALSDRAAEKTSSQNLAGGENDKQGIAEADLSDKANTAASMASGGLSGLKAIDKATGEIVPVELGSKRAEFERANSSVARKQEPKSDNRVELDIPSDYGLYEESKGEGAPDLLAAVRQGMAARNVVGDPNAGLVDGGEREGGIVPFAVRKAKSFSGGDFDLVRKSVDRSLTGVRNAAFRRRIQRVENGKGDANDVKWFSSLLDESKAKIKQARQDVITKEKNEKLRESQKNDDEQVERDRVADLILSGNYRGVLQDRYADFLDTLPDRSVILGKDNVLDNVPFLTWGTSEDKKNAEVDTKKPSGKPVKKDQKIGREFMPSFELDNGLTVSVEWAVNPKAYKGIYNEAGYIVSFAFKGEGFYKSVAGVTFKGRVSRPAVKKRAVEIAKGLDYSAPEKEGVTDDIKKAREAEYQERKAEAKDSFEEYWAGSIGASVEGDIKAGRSRDVRIDEQQAQTEFKPTHELEDGTPVVKSPDPDDEGIWIDETGDEWEGEASPFLEEKNTEQENKDVSSTASDLERDRKAESNAKPDVQENVSDESGASGRGVESTGGEPGENAGGDAQRSNAVSEDQPVTDRTSGDKRVDSETATTESGESTGDVTGSAERAGSDSVSKRGESPNERAGDKQSERDVSTGTEQAGERGKSEVDKPVEAGATSGLSLEDKVKLQEATEDLPHVENDLDNIRETLPVLLPEQQEDVKFAEERFSDDKNLGVLFTNGTGTGKTFTGLGLIKRFVRQGKDNILVTVPSDKIARDWVSSAKYLGIDIKQLSDTKDNGGSGVAVTSYANMYQNHSLPAREWDLLVFDESHRLGQNQAGTETEAESMFRAIGNHPKRLYRKAHLLHADAEEKLKRRVINAIKKHDKSLGKASIESLENKEIHQLLPDLEKLHAPTFDRLSKQNDNLTAKIRKTEEKLKKSSKPSKVAFLSATPFAYQKSLRYADGYLFDSGEFEDKRNAGGYNVAEGFDSFLQSKFGYEMKYGRLQRPDASFNPQLAERNFNKELKASGALRGRRLKVDADYSREFVLIEGGPGKKIDEGARVLWDRHEEFSGLAEQFRKNFDYLARLQSLESLKAEESVERIKKHHALGRKVVVFHDFKQNNAAPPFVFHPDSRVKKETIDKFNAEFPELVSLRLGNGSSVVDRLLAEFPTARAFNGDVSKADRNKSVKVFNKDGSDVDVLVVQRQAGKEGISLHDTTGKHQRVLIDLGLPARPTDAIQTEGRIYRTGVVTDAIIEYSTTGLDYENHTFAEAVAGRSSTAENLALGHEGRNLLTAFVDAYEAADTFNPHGDQGKGGKESDVAMFEEVSDFEQAVNHYFGKQKVSGRRDNREGKDFFATPEPVGMKMAEWLGLRDGESAMEPSAGDGAIARWFPAGTENTFVEPSYSLSGKLGMLGNGTVKQQSFEKLNIVNKFDGVAMNPPFGVGGKTAIEHLDKAFKHLRDGGRVVALIPEGPSADKRFDKWYEDLKDGYQVGNVSLPSVTFEKAGTKVKTRIVVIDRVPKKWLDAGASVPHMRQLDFDTVESTKDLFEQIEDVDFGDRVVESKNKDDVRFSLKSDESAALDHVELDAVIKRVSSSWSNSPDVVAVDSFSGLPVEILQAAHEQGANPEDIRAVQHGGKVYLVRDKLQSSKDAEQVLFHEVYGHYGLRALFGKDLHRKLNEFHRAIGGKSGFAKLADKYGLGESLKPYLDGSKKWSVQNRNALMMDELLAHVAQNETGRIKQKALEVLGIVRQWLRDHGFIQLGKMNRADIAYLLRESRRAVHGGASSGKNKDIRFSLKADAPDTSVFADVDKEADAVGLERSKELLKKSGQWFKDKASEFGVNGGLGLLTLRQLVEVGGKALPMAEQYMSRVEKMLTERNKMQDESAKLALRWQKLSKKERNRLAHVMHESTMEGIDPSLEAFAPGEVLVYGGMDSVRRALGENVSVEAGSELKSMRVPATAKNLELLRKYKLQAQKGLRNARTSNKDTLALKRDAAERAQNEWRSMKNQMLNDRSRSARFKPLRRKFRALDAEAQQVFTEARDMYLARSARTEEALLKTIDRAELSEKYKKKAVTAIRAEFESARLQGVYFPLFRKGEYFVRSKRRRDDIDKPSTYLKNPGKIMEVVGANGSKRWQLQDGREFDSVKRAERENTVWKSKEAAMASAHSRQDLIGKRLVAFESPDGGWVLQDDLYEPVFTMHGTAAEAERAAKALTDHEDVRFGKLDKVQSQDDFAVSGSFLADVFGVMKDSNVDEKVQDDVYQLYLQTLPELSQRKHFIHRKKTAGFSENALQSFANNMGHQAHQVSKLEAREDLQGILETISEHVQEVDQDQAVLAGNVRDEITRRHDWVMNPNNAGWTNWTSSFGFFMYLGASPAAALVNLSQTAVVAYPILGAEYGWGKAGKALNNAVTSLNMKETALGEGALDLSRLNALEKKALQAWNDEGVIDRSQAHMLAGIGDSDSFQNSPGYQKWMGRVAHLFHKAEIVNREVTLLAGYRLARDAGKSHEVATKEAADMTWDAHFDYSNANRARFMQGDFAKLFLMFRSYSQHMVYFMLRNARQWGKDGEDGKKARARLLGLLGVTLAIGGVSALPIGMVGAATGLAAVQGRYGTKRAVQVGGAMGGLLLLAGMLWDDEEPFDWQAETRAALREMGGDSLEALVFRGGLNAATGIDVSTRVSLSDLVIRGSNRELEGRDLATHYVQQALGPVVGYGVGTGAAMQMWSEDHEYRAIEKMMPKFARDVMKTGRYGTEGALNMRGDEVVGRDLLGVYSDELNMWNLFWQAQGFNPEKVSRQYDKTADLKNYENHIKRRKKRIMSRYYLAYVEKDQDGMREAQEAAEKWNAANPKAKPIDDKMLARSVKTRLRYSEESVNGVSVQKSLRYLVDELGVE